MLQPFTHPKRAIALASVERDRRRIEAPPTGSAPPRRQWPPPARLAAMQKEWLNFLDAARVQANPSAGSDRLPRPTTTLSTPTTRFPEGELYGLDWQAA